MSLYRGVMISFLTRPMFWLFTAIAGTLLLVAIANRTDRVVATSPDVINANFTSIKTADELKALEQTPQDAQPVQVHLDKVLGGWNALFAHPLRVSNDQLEAYAKAFTDVPLPAEILALETGGWGAYLLPRIGQLKTL